jgi:hypothetical protein
LNPKHLTNARTLSASECGRLGGLSIKHFPVDILKESDWQRILELRWSDKLSRLLRLLKEKGNSPQSVSDLAIFMKGFAHSKMGSINHKFRKAGLPYRLGKVQHGGDWLNAKVRLVVVQEIIRD